MVSFRIRHGRSAGLEVSLQATDHEMSRAKGRGVHGALRGAGGCREYCWVAIAGIDSLCVEQVENVKHVE